MSSFIITFRETLESSLIVGIVLAFLKKTKNQKYNKVVYLAVALSLFFSFLFAFVFLKVYGSFSGKAEEIFEGITMIIGSFLLTTMILWMFNNQNIKKELQNKVSENLSKENVIGIFLLVFFSILREGIETVIFLFAASFLSASNNLFSAILGIITALIIGYLFYNASLKLNVKLFFNITSILLIFFAAGLLAHGIHELEEAGIVNPIIKEIWNLNPTASEADKGIYPIMHEKGLIGSILVSLFGYNANPSLLEFIFYISYFVIIFFSYIFIKKKSIKKEKT
ncbi:MAG: FTR1 family protein [Candidatus Woesearchaeota archaeon]